MSTLKQLRLQHYISQKELATLAGVSESSVIRMEDPSHLTRKDIAEKVLNALSTKTGQEYTLENVAGLNVYNVMKHRRQRGKSETQEAA